jgi:hypothetical protein
MTALQARALPHRRGRTAQWQDHRRMAAGGCDGRATTTAWVLSLSLQARMRLLPTQWRSVMRRCRVNHLRRGREACGVLRWGSAQ